MIFSDYTKQSQKFSVPEPYVQKVILNHTGYCDQKTHFDMKPQYRFGALISLKDGTPIGYNIHLPAGEIKGIIVNVYGGYNVQDKDEGMSLPEEYTIIERSLLNEGIALVTLNLADLLELYENQRLMSKELHERLHASINQFYEVLKDPQRLKSNLLEGAELFELLITLKNKKIILMGSSFGGRTAVKHAELFPSTFDGYISFSGALSYKMREKCAENSEQAGKWLDPINDITRIEDPILLIHNLDDNRVNVKVTLDWYKNAIKKGKKEKVSLLIIEKGGPINAQEPTKKGHVTTDDLTLYRGMMEAILCFIENGSNSMSAIHEWRAHHYNILANSNYPAASLEQKFISLAYRLHQQGTTLNEENWQKHFVPLYYALQYLHNCSDNTKFKDKCQSSFHGEFDKNLNKLNAQGQLTPEIVKKAIQFYIKNYLSYLQDVQFIPGYDKDNIEALVNNKEVHKQFLFKILGSTLGFGQKIEYSLYKYLISALYTANPHLLKEHYPKWDDDLRFQINLIDAHEKLISKINKERELINSVWQQAVKKIKTR